MKLQKTAEARLQAFPAQAGNASSPRQAHFWTFPRRVNWSQRRQPDAMQIARCIGFVYSRRRKVQPC